MFWLYQWLATNTIFSGTVYTEGFLSPSLCLSPPLAPVTTTTWLPRTSTCTHWYKWHSKCLWLWTVHFRGIHSKRNSFSGLRCENSHSKGFTAKAFTSKVFSSTACNLTDNIAGQTWLADQTSACPTQSRLSTDATVTISSRGLLPVAMYNTLMEEETSYIYIYI